MLLPSMHPPRESGEVSGTYTFLSVTSPHRSLPRLRVFPMFSPNLPALQQLHRLNRSSSEFYDQLYDTLRGKEYTECVPNLRGDDSVWLVEYLDNVRPMPPSPTPRFSCRRFSTAWTLPAPLSGSVYVNSGGCAVQRG